MNITDTTFEEETKSGISIIDFWADWCKPCLAISSTIDELEKKYKEEGIKVLKVNVDSSECSQLTVKFGIRNIPTIVILKDGKEIVRRTGTGQVIKTIEEMVLKAKEL